MACNLLIEHMKNIGFASPLSSWLKNSKYPEAFPFSPLIGAQIQKSEMLTYKVAKTTSFIFSPIMVNYEFSNHNRSICFNVYALCLCSSLDICSLQAVFTYKWIFFPPNPQCSPLNNKIPAGRACVILQEKEEIAWQSFLPAELTN